MLRDVVSVTPCCLSCRSQTLSIVYTHDVLWSLKQSALKESLQGKGCIYRKSNPRLTDIHVDSWRPGVPQGLEPGQGDSEDKAAHSRHGHCLDDGMCNSAQGLGLQNPQFSTALSRHVTRMDDDGTWLCWKTCDYVRVRW